MSYCRVGWQPLRASLLFVAQSFDHRRCFTRTCSSMSVGSNDGGQTTEPTNNAPPRAFLYFLYLFAYTLQLQFAQRWLDLRTYLRMRTCEGACVLHHVYGQACFPVIFLLLSQRKPLSCLHSRLCLPRRLRSQMLSNHASIDTCGGSILIQHLRTLRHV